MDSWSVGIAGACRSVLMRWHAPVQSRREVGMSMTNGEKKSGKVKWFNDAKGFGFIQQDGGGADVFVHHSQIQQDGYRSLAENDPVQFEVETGPKGLKAVNVSKLPS